GTGRAGAAAGAGSQAAAAGGAAVKAKKTLWYLDDEGRLAVVLVETGASDDAKTELVGADELEGVQVIVKLLVR
ncbi:MAG: hypothetical protein KKB59_15095, partial [Spirochaetes bacterium]|nr:hypothetical protein [Spirochaetota bacterium]